MGLPHEIAADRIPVSLFREILIWPLALHLPDRDSDPDRLNRAMASVINRLTRSEPRTDWRPVDDPIKHIPPPRDPARRLRWEADCYAEGVYFHEFVQSFLFSARCEWPAAGAPRDPQQEPFRLFQRTDLREVTVKMQDTVPLTFDVERVNLYLFRTGAAILIVEIVIQTGYLRGLNLADVLNFHDLFRRVYPPYARHVRHPDGRSELSPQLVVESVTWRRFPSSGADKTFHTDANSVGCMVGKYLEPPEDDDETRRRRFAPISEHWLWLLEDALPLAPRDKLKDDPRWGADEGRWHQVVDDRMPTLTTVSVCGTDTNPRYHFDRTRRGDLVRLCFADRYSGDPYPYDPDFLEDFEKNHVYGRFRDSGTLYLASGYSFVAYGAATSFFEDVIATHMRRHYFQMGLLAHFELASLLAFSTRISRAVESHDTDPEGFEQRMQNIEDEFLQFIHRFRFTGVSNHVQAQELFDLWRRHLRLKDIFDDLLTEISSGTRYLSNRSMSRDTRLTGRLSAIATLGLILALAFSFLGMNVFIDEGTLQRVFNRDITDIRFFSAMILSCVAFFAGVGWVALRWLTQIGEIKSSRPLSRHGNRWRTILRFINKVAAGRTQSAFDRSFQIGLFALFFVFSFLAIAFVLWSIMSGSLPAGPG
jgi:hypothetical protein